ncbi:hypothetical protein [Marinagarivorans cellulosilyticus]|uniref:Uncharacterized protein n=1 Tax=Marinagarivorans cellulosilyticus TaxID=2721545 RepID=A0AAN1WIV6_9GAMM|nr:hypothetical protein [Marinagarivorans cellulosilyticus]BCD98425.1 hypothetical protein MARGE09_P2626 [Marinagarivorans cellulosilyticus]
MENLLIVLAVLFVGIIIMVNLAKWFGPNSNTPSIQKLSRWIFPLLAIGFVIQLINHFMNQ